MACIAVEGTITGTIICITGTITCVAVEGTITNL